MEEERTLKDILNDIYILFSDSNDHNKFILQMEQIGIEFPYLKEKGILNTFEKLYSIPFPKDQLNLIKEQLKVLEGLEPLYCMHRMVERAN